MLLEVELNRSKPGSSWSTRWATPVHRQTTDGCSQSTCVVLGWTSTSNVSEQTQPSGRDKVSGWWLAGPASDFVVRDVCYIWNTQDMTLWHFGMHFLSYLRNSCVDFNAAYQITH